MVKKCEKKLIDILNYYSERNKNNNYSKKLYKILRKEVGYLIDFPKLGKKTDLQCVRGLLVKNYIVFYEHNSDYITIHSIWDSRENPDKIEIK